MERRIYALLLAALCMIPLTGCSRGDHSKEDDHPDTVPETVDLTVWGAEEDQELLSQIVQDFQTRYQDEADLRITVQAQGESACKDALLSDLKRERISSPLPTTS